MSEKLDRLEIETLTQVKQPQSWVITISNILFIGSAISSNLIQIIDVIITSGYFLLFRPMTAGSRVWVSADGSLQVQAVRASDAGEYSCVVTSPGGNHTRQAVLSVIELPFAPTNVRAVRLESTPQRAINVSWTPGFDGNSPIQKFIVQRRVVPEFGMKYIGRNLSIQEVFCYTYKI